MAIGGATGRAATTATAGRSRSGGPRASRAAGYRCAECGWTTVKWVGRCGECGAWGTLEEAAQPVGITQPRPASTAARPIAEVDLDIAAARPTGVGELDRVLGGGLVRGAVLLLAGEPGVGKSTLLLEVAAACAGADARTLYVSGEESAGQVRLRAERVGALDPHLFLAAEQDLGALLAHVDAVRPSLLVVDSVQTLASADVDGVAGGVTQVREVAATVTRVAKERGIATVLVGHVTKDGSIAGPRQLEHLVDVVLHVEGERGSPLRLVRAVKNRYGPTDEVGCFELVESGIREIADPSGLFVSRRLEAVPGTCTAVALEGRRPLLAEVQALVARSALPSPRRATSGLDGSRVAMVLAVCERRGGLRLQGMDTFLATVGGVRVTEPAADLAVAFALASATQDNPLPSGMVAIGEIGLAGEVRQVAGLERRLAEAHRLGFRVALVPAGPGGTPTAGPSGMRVVSCRTVVEAFAAARRMPAALAVAADVETPRAAPRPALVRRPGQ